jgi:hypothetical protein
LLTGSKSPHRLRAKYAGLARKIATPMLPILRHLYVRTGDLTRLPYGQVVGFYRPMVTELTKSLEDILQLSKMSPEAVAAGLKVALPRIAVFKRLFSLVGADVDDIERAADRLLHLSADHAYKLRRAIETQRAKFMYRGVSMPIPSFMQVIRPAILNLPQPENFAIVVDFSTVGAIGPFLKAVLTGLANDEVWGNVVKSQLEGLFGEVTITPKGVRIRDRNTRRMRALRFTELEQIAPTIIAKYLSKRMDGLFFHAVQDIFFIEPTSVSRWFPARPMGRKSLGGQGLAQMLMSGHAVFLPTTISKGKKGFAGAFMGFDTQRAPYWHVVQYGFHGMIEPTTSPFLTLRDPDPEWWSRVQWLFGARTRPDILKENYVTISKTSGTRYHPFTITQRGRVVHKRGKHSTPVEFGKVRIPVMMPSGYPRFTMRLHSSAEIRKVRERARKVLTYEVTIRPHPIRKKRVRGQRASLFIERILAKIAERQKLLQPDLFNAATAFVTLAEKEWNRVASTFAAAGFKLGGKL